MIGVGARAPARWRIQFELKSKRNRIEFRLKMRCVTNATIEFEFNSKRNRIQFAAKRAAERGHIRAATDELTGQLFAPFACLRQKGGTIRSDSRAHPRPIVMPQLSAPRTQSPSAGRPLVVAAGGRSSRTSGSRISCSFRNRALGGTGAPATCQAVQMAVTRRRRRVGTLRVQEAQPAGVGSPRGRLRSGEWPGAKRAHHSSPRHGHSAALHGRPRPRRSRRVSAAAARDAGLRTQPDTGKNDSNC